jgi:hypothetical protein
MDGISASDGGGAGASGGGGGGPPFPVGGDPLTPPPPENAFFARAAALTSKAGWPEVHGGAVLCADARYSCVRPAPRAKVETAC